MCDGDFYFAREFNKRTQNVILSFLAKLSECVEFGYGGTIVCFAYYTEIVRRYNNVIFILLLRQKQ